MKRQLDHNQRLRAQSFAVQQIGDRVQGLGRAVGERCHHRVGYFAGGQRGLGRINQQCARILKAKRLDEANRPFVPIGARQQPGIGFDQLQGDSLARRRHATLKRLVGCVGPARQIGDHPGMQTGYRSEAVCRRHVIQQG